MASEREETLVEQLQLRDQQIEQLKALMEEAMRVMGDLEAAAVVMLEAWNKQHLRLVELEAYIKGAQK
jgi:acyl-homoserine lactone acylase PvdQ